MNIASKRRCAAMLVASMLVAGPIFYQCRAPRY